MRGFLFLGKGTGHKPVFGAHKKTRRSGSCR